jgi:hypothetical protein
LAYCALHALPTETYTDLDHPLQQAVRKAVADVAGVASKDMAWGVDGCSAPNFAMPLSSLARAYARLATPESDTKYGNSLKVLGEAMSKESDQDIAITTTYRKLTGKYPSAKELNILKALYKQELDKFRMNPEKTKGWLSAGLYKVNAQVDKALVAANAVVANTIMNSDASITKR